MPNTHSYSSAQHEQEKLTARIQSTCIFIIVVDSFFNAGFMYQLILSVTNSFFSAFAIAVVMGAVYYKIASTVAVYGIRKLPFLDAITFSKSFPIWLGFSGFIACLSLYLSVVFIGLLPAQDEYIKKAVQKVNTFASNTIQAQRKVEALEAPLLAKINALDILLKNEKQSGSVCSKGGGLGECFSMIGGLKAEMNSIRNQLMESKASSAPLIRRIEDNQDTLRRLAKNKDIDFSERVEAMKKEMALMILDIENLQKIIPIPALENAIETFSRDFKTAGIGDIGASRLKDEFRPIAQLLRDKIGGLKEASNRYLKPINSPSNLEILTQGIQAIIPIVAIAFLMAFSPIALCFCLLVADRDHDNFSPSDRDNLTDLNLARGKKA